MFNTNDFSILLLLFSNIWLGVILKKELAARKLNFREHKISLFIALVLFLFFLVLEIARKRLDFFLLILFILFACLLIFLRLAPSRGHASANLATQVHTIDKMIESLPVPLMYKDLEGAYVRCNVQFLKFLSKTRDEVLGKKASDVMSAENAREIGENEAELLRSGELQIHDILLKNLHGEERFVRIYKTLVTDVFGEPTGILGCFVDLESEYHAHREIQERKEQLEFFSEQLEKQMGYEISRRLHSERRYKQLFDSAREGNFVAKLSEDGQEILIIEANSSAHAMFDFLISDFRNRDFGSLLECEKRAEIERRIRKLPFEHGALFECRFLLPNSRTIPVEISVQSFFFEEQKMLYISARDITERLKLEEERRIQENLLVQQSKLASMGEMIGAIAHQWKQPLNAIYLMCQGLRESFVYNELDEAEVERFVGDTMKQVEFMSQTITDFRSFFLPSKDKRAFALKEALTEMYGILAPQFVKNEISVQITQEDHGNIVAYGYPNEFKQVALNIMNNARDAIESRIAKGENIVGRIEVKISQTDKRVGDYACVRIEDNGGGIPKDLLKTIFEPYFSTKGDKGTGIGLSIAKMIIENNMEGKISVHNEKEGAVFEILLPLAKSERA